MMVGYTRAGLMAVLVATAACNGSLAPAVCGDGGSCGSQTTITKTFQQSFNRDLDVLFVVDDTSAIAPWADNLRAGYPAMARVLEDLPYGGANLHVGFVRASRCAVPDTRARDCGVAAPDAFLRHESCSASSNFAGSFVDAFACLADLGTQACGPAQPFETVREVFAQPPPAGWQGFLRPDAALQIVFIAGQDLPSDAAVSDLTALVRALKPDPATILVSVMVPGDCPVAEPTPRLVALAQNFGGNGALVGLCGGSLEGVFSQLRTGPVWVLLPPCLGGVLDIDATTPGVQAGCTLQDTTVAPDGTRVTTVLPTCDVAAPPCYLLTESPVASCTVAFDIVRPADRCMEANSSTRIECLAAKN